MTERAVAIAGGGPSGLMLACALALAGVDAAIVERRASQELDSSRSGGLQPRTLEVLDQHSIADRFHQQHAAGRHGVEPHKQDTGEEQRDELDGEDGGGRHQRLDSSFFGEMVGEVPHRL
ncbi:MAG TPA: FAD-dependent monooxygenase, partial [Propionibacteriaceae bacterium]|nr:FAD-dependent monooxygenase [Propionibacteriaceae bacterium]